jgi:hypothetical protein
MGASDHKNPGVVAMTGYSFKTPSTGTWGMERSGGPVEVVVLKKNVDEADHGPALVELKVIRNLIAEGRRLAEMSGKEHAVNIRNMERDIMLEQGVKPGLYQLHDVTMGEETVAGKQFYFMDYRTETTSDMQPSSLYLFFPKGRNNQWFIMVHYTQVWSKERKPMNYSKSDLIDVLRTLELEIK